jgi:hypothetical protein
VVGEPLIGALQTDGRLNAQIVDICPDGDVSVSVGYVGAPEPIYIQKISILEFQKGLWKWQA